MGLSSLIPIRRVAPSKECEFLHISRLCKGETIGDFLPVSQSAVRDSLGLAGNQPDCPHCSLPKPGLGADERGLEMGCGEE